MLVSISFFLPMKTIFTVIIAVSILAIVGFTFCCSPWIRGGEDETTQERSETLLTTEERELHEQQEVGEVSETGQMKGNGIYTAFSPDVIGNGKTSVLFFHSKWCGECRRDEKALKQWQEENGLPVSVYKVDYGSATDLKNRYNVAQQNTYVVIDGKGNAISSVSFPGLKKLEALLTANAQ